jgi:hypothetical protein
MRRSKGGRGRAWGLGRKGRSARVRKEEEEEARRSNRRRGKQWRQ